MARSAASKQSFIQTTNKSPVETPAMGRLLLLFRSQKRPMPSISDACQALRDRTRSERRSFAAVSGGRALSGGQAARLLQQCTPCYDAKLAMKSTVNFG